MPPELVEIFKDAPGVLLFLFLGAPFLVLIGVLVTVVVQRVRDKGLQKVAEQTVGISLKVAGISEKEAATHEFQAIIDGFSKSIGVISDRAKSAEDKAAAAETKANEATDEVAKLVRRVRHLEDERHDAIDHVILLESMVPYPPGPPPRPLWMRPARERVGPSPHTGEIPRQ